MIVRRTLVDPIFNAAIELVVCTVPEVRQWIADHPEFIDTDDDDVWHGAHAVTLESSTGPTQWLVWLSPAVLSLHAEQLGTLVHESAHITAQVLRDRGLTLSADSEEAFAYYQTAIFVQLLDALKASLTKHQRDRSTKNKSKRRRV